MRRPALFVAMAVVCAALVPGMRAGDGYVFKSDVSLVRVDAQVVDSNNRAITGLSANDFVLREEGAPQEISNFAREDMPLDVLLLLDVSGSMQPHVQRIASASHQALQELADQDRVAIMVFDRTTRVRLPFRNSREDVERELENVLSQETFDGGTDVARGLMDAARYMEANARKDARRAIVILTDDQSERGSDHKAILRELTRSDTVLSLLLAPDAMRSGRPGIGYPRRGGGGIGGPLGGPLGGIIFGRRMPGGGGGGPVITRPQTHSAGTDEVAKESGGDTFKVDNAGSLDTTLQRLRQRYALHFHLPQGVQPGSERQIEVSLSDAAMRRYPGAEVHFRRTYMAPGGPPEPVVVADEGGLRTRPPAGTSSGNGGWRRTGEQASAPAASQPAPATQPAPPTTASSPPPASSSPAPATDSQQGGWRRVEPDGGGWRRVGSEQP